MAQVKGTAIRASIRYLQDRFGGAGLGRVLDQLTPEERATLGEGILDSVWYPMSLLHHLMQSAQRALGETEPYLLREMGRVSADLGVRGVYEVFFKVGSPQFIIARASRVFGSYYDTGDVRTVESGPGHAVMDVSGLEEAGPEFCERIRGWMERTVELAGGKNLRSNHDRCRYRGDSVCRFEGHWD